MRYITPLPEYLKLRRTMPNTDEDMHNRGGNSLLGLGGAKQCRHFAAQLGSATKIPTTWARQSTPRCWPKRNESRCPGKNIQECSQQLYLQEPKPKTAQMSINSRIHKATAVSPHNRILLSNKKESTINTHRMERSRNNYAEWKKRGKKEYTVHGSIYINL